MLVIKYIKEGRAKFISHLDMLKHMGKILRRANVKVEFSKGFNPHELLYFSPACVCGSTSDCEYMVVATNENKDEFLKKFNSVEIEGIVGLKTWEVAKNPNLAAICNEAEYVFEASEKEIENIQNAFNKEIHEITFTHKGEEKTQDVRDKMISFCVATAEDSSVLKNGEQASKTVHLILATGGSNIRTDRFLPSVEIETAAKRINLFASYGGKTLNVDELLEEVQI